MTAIWRGARSAASTWRAGATTRFRAAIPSWDDDLGAMVREKEAAA